MSGPTSELSQHEPPGSASAEDPASLRAAALRTIRPKRRKAGSAGIEQTNILPPRSFVAPSSIQLDYGQEEPSPGASSTASSAPAASTARLPATAPPPPEDIVDVEEPQAREEGEISESETVPPTPVVKPAKPIYPEPRPPPQEVTRQSSIPKLPPPQIKTESLPVSLPLDSASSSASAVSPQQLPSATAPLYILDADHVRPGLSMTQEEYDAAKDLVLDLLGWGVPPEYLITSGISRTIVYYVFVELNLRFPTNLDTTGIIPYEPPTFEGLSPVVTTVASRSSTDVPPGPDHPNLPPKPSVPRERTPSESTSQPQSTYTLSALAPSFVASPSSASLAPVAPDLDLLDMEQQRRQELLARKAVMASRKLKQQSSIGGGSSLTPSTPVSPESQDVEMTAQVPKSVDDFLKSIEPADDNGNAAAVNTTSLGRTNTYDAMDVDDHIPGLSAVDDALYASRQSRSPSRSMSISDIASPVAISAPVPTSLMDTTSSSRPPSAMGTAVGGHFSMSGSDTEMDIPGLVPERSRSGSGGPGSATARRGGKRPVAADFVDMDPMSSRPPSSDGFGNYPTSLKRKHGSFAGVSGMRRCVINLSDSEDELEHGHRDILRTRRLYEGSVPYGGVSSYAAYLRSGSPGPSKVVTPSTTPAGIMSPVALLAKEEEIRKMRELIREREQIILRKLAATQSSRTSTPPFANSTNAAITVKREEDDSLYAESLAGSSRHPTEPGTPNGVPKKERSATPIPPGLSIALPDSGSRSTSSAATPIDVIVNAYEHATTGDRVLTAEARQEQVVNGIHHATIIPQAQVQVGVVGSDAVTSAQIEAPSNSIQEPQQDQARALGFVAYSSPFDWYPALRPHPQHQLSGAVLRAAPQHQHSVEASALNWTSSLDLKALKFAAARRLMMDPSKRICQYEIPGGGECRDRECDDLHPSRLSSAEPSDDETAQYLHAAMPPGSLYSVRDFLDALEGARRRHPAKAFDDRVLEALVSLGLR